jgi:hypothetical protein
VQELTYNPLISTRSLKRRWRVEVELDAIIIDEKYRVVISHLPVLDHVAIVQHKPISIQPCPDNGGCSQRGNSTFQCRWPFQHPEFANE